MFSCKIKNYPISIWSNIQLQSMKDSFKIKVELFKKTTLSLISEINHISINNFIASYKLIQ